jgi:hypothetical protein
MPGGTGLDQTTLIVYTELATVDVAEVDLHSGKFAAEPLQKPIHFVSDKLDHSRIYRYVFVAIDLNPHAFLCSRLHWGGQRLPGGLIRGWNR